MISKLCTLAAVAVAGTLLTAAAANAAPVFVGSWNVNDGPSYYTDPLAYSSVGAARLLFGPGSYAISTVDSNPADINHQAWYNVIGVGAATFAQDYFRGTEGVTHYQDVWLYDAAVDTVSAYVQDFEDSYTVNYAFRTAAPEPASLALLGVGLLGLGILRWRQR